MPHRDIHTRAREEKDGDTGKGACVMDIKTKMRVHTHRERGTDTKGGTRMRKIRTDERERGTSENIKHERNVL